MGAPAKKDRDNIQSGVKDLKPKNLYHALGEIEQFSLVERSSSDQARELLTTIGRLYFTESGFIEAVGKGVLCMLTTPIMFMAQNHMLMFAGGTNASSMDSLMMLLISALFAIGNGIAVYVVFSNCYAGTVTRSTMSAFCLGATMGKALVTFINFLLAHYITLRVLSADNMVSMALRIGTIFKRNPEAALQAYKWLLQIKEILIPAFNFIVIMNLIFIAVVWVGLLISIWKTKKLVEFKAIWQ